MSALVLVLVVELLLLMFGGVIGISILFSTQVSSILLLQRDYACEKNQSNVSIQRKHMFSRVQNRLFDVMSDPNPIKTFISKNSVWESFT